MYSSKEKLLALSSMIDGAEGRGGEGEGGGTVFESIANTVFDFSRSVLRRCCVVALVQGNLTAESAKCLGEIL